MSFLPLRSSALILGSLVVISVASQNLSNGQQKANGRKQPPQRSVPAQKPENDDEDALYEEAVAKRALEENCLICHEESMITRQRLTGPQWTGEIDKMISWGAPLPVDAKQSLIDFLSRHYSDRQSLIPPSRIALKNVESLELPDGTQREQTRGDPSRGEILYSKNCANCHGPRALGAELGPSLVNKAILAHAQPYHSVVRNGMRRMPGFQNVLSTVEEEDLLSWLRAQKYP
jgi:ubiquinol-cytochrome c reductase cytochrome c subunit